MIATAKKINDQDKKLKKVILVFEDGSTKEKPPRETLAEARERLENKMIVAHSVTDSDVREFLKPKMNELGSYIDVAYNVLCNRGLTNDKAWNLISKLMQSEVFE